ncbi:MAG: polyprenol monophosphomannose synthase [Actinomycetaceae bacterium]|nr:polyprenol monophosphomannose synthase [Actinomycetaceae bacterium]
MSEVLVIIPTYNEVESLPLILKRLFDAVRDIHVLVVDDNSPDGTGELAEGMSRDDPRIHVLHRTQKEGLGPAYLAGFAWAMERHYSHVVEMDADGSHAPEQLPRLLTAALGTKKPDLVIGARWLPGGQVKGWSKRRQLLSRGGNLYIRFALGMPLTDVTAGFRVYKVDFLKKMPLDRIESKGYGFQIEMTWKAWQRNARVHEVPTTFSERHIGTSKMSGSIIREAFVSVARWAINERLKPFLSGNTAQNVRRRRPERNRSNRSSKRT